MYKSIIFLCKGLLFVTLISSCQKEDVITNQGNQFEEIISNANTDKCVMAMGIINDFQEFYTQVALNDSLFLSNKFNQQLTRIERNQNHDPVAFFVNDLGVNANLVSKIANYDQQKLAVLRYEIDYPESDGYLFNCYLDNVNSNKIPCGGWGPVRLVALTAGCLSGAAFLCSNAYDEWKEQIDSGCFGG